MSPIADPPIRFPNRWLVASLLVMPLAAPPSVQAAESVATTTTNHPPVAVATGTPDRGGSPLQVLFDGRGSRDPDGDALTYRWSSPGLGLLSTAAQFPYTFNQPGEYQVFLEVSDGRVPADLDGLWGIYDPTREPLDTQVVREWTEGTMTLRMVIFTVGTFKGRASRLAGFYGFPTGRTGLPAVLQIHGGGQNAALRPVRDFARRNYACLSINWGGQPIEKMQPGDPNTDWGAIDPTQNHNGHYFSTDPDARTPYPFTTPRNNNWFMLVLAGRRSLTFLERQPEVDGQRLGVTGHSMGGKITTDLVGIDHRVKAAAPSCGGAGSLRGKPWELAGGTGEPAPPGPNDDEVYLSRIACPIMFASPTNDFNAPFDHMTVNGTRIPASTPVAYAIPPHLNHRHTPETTLSMDLWFDQHLKQSFSFPQNPRLTVELAGPGGIPRATVVPDRMGDVAKVDLFYSIDRDIKNRFWRDAQATRSADGWTGSCPVMSVDQPLFVYANVYYRLAPSDPNRTSPLPETFLMSSGEAIHLPRELQAAGVVATDERSRLIDDFARGWQDWYQLEWANPHYWSASTRKVKDPKWQGPVGARLVFEVSCPTDTVLAIVATVNSWSAYPGRPSGTFAARKPLHGSPDWQTMSVSLEEMLPDTAGKPGMPDWQTMTELSLHHAATYLKDGQEVPFGSGWTVERKFRNLRWEGGSYPAMAGSAVSGE